MKSNKELFNNPFFHIYVEKEAFLYENTQKIISNFKNSHIIEISHYKDIFCRNRQNYKFQKKTQNIIIAVKKNNLIYKGAPVCQSFGNEYFYYTSSVMNCIYDCEYCYLQGMYPSANIVIFVNLDDIFDEAEKILKSHSAYICISYDTDLLAIENILGYVRKWFEFAENHKNLKIELRTKSSNFEAIEDITPKENIILAWTLSPEVITNKFEIKTPSLKNRINSINSALKKGWNVRLCFDPLIYCDDFKNVYEEFIKFVFSNIEYEKLFDVSIGVFRISHDYLKEMRKQRPDSVILNYPYDSDFGVFHYGNKLSENMVDYVMNLIKLYISKEKIYIWKENN